MIHAVFAFTAFGAVIALATYTIEADAASAADLIIRTVFTFVGTFVGTFRADLCTVRASISTGAYLLHAVFT